MKFNSKVFFKVFIFLLIAVVLSVYLYGSGHRSCYHFVENLNYNCDNISDLENYIDYNMLSNDLKKLIKEEDFKFSNAEEQYQFCRLLKNLNYEYKENPDNVYSTDKLGRNELSRRVIIDDKEYSISISIVFKPKVFLGYKIVGLNADIIEIPVEN